MLDRIKKVNSNFFINKKKHAINSVQNIALKIILT